MPNRKKRKITLEDINKALKFIYLNQPPNKTKEYFWGWLETDYVGNPISIKFKRNQIKAIRMIMKENFGFGREHRLEDIKKNTRLETIFGIKVLNHIRMDVGW